MIVLLLGGSRSGKSELAERWAARLGPPVTYLATYRPGPAEPSKPPAAGADPVVGFDPAEGSHPASDSDMARRVALHRQRRPLQWATREVGEDLAEVLGTLAGTVLIDSLGTWIAGHRDLDADVEGLCRGLANRSGDSVVVSDEVGLGVHPETALGRRFRDALGTANRAVADVADRCVLVVAGRALELPSAQELWS